MVPPKKQHSGSTFTRSWVYAAGAVVVRNSTMKIKGMKLLSELFMVSVSPGAAEAEFDDTVPHIVYL